MTYESEIRAGQGEPVTVGPDGQERRPRSRRVIVAGLAVLALAIAAWFFLRSGDEAPPTSGDDQLPVVSVVVPGRTTVEGEITATGTLAARRELPVGVVGEGGRVISVPVDEGAWVRQGQVLAVIDRSVQSQQAQGAAAQINVAQADANLAQANLDRALKLVERGFISKADVDRLTATRDAAVARVRVAQAQLRELNARNARLNIVAPAAGLVLTRAVEPGQTVGGGSPALFTIAKGGELELMARLGETELALVKTGSNVEVTPVGTDKSFIGQVWQIAPTIDAQDRQGTARVALAYAPELRPGGFATAVIRSGTTVAPVLPESAIQTDEEGDFVYIVDGENRVVRRAIKPGVVTAQGIIVAQGLSGSERVILRAGGFVNPGEKVKPVSGKR